jgi:outer membrane protein OmpA-like peptidoglycan-associated protein
MDLIENIRTYLTPELIQKASALVGESPSNTRRALETAVPTVVAALAAHASSPTGARGLLHVIEETGLRGPMGVVAERLGENRGEDLVALGKDLLRRLCGDRLDRIVGATASSGVVQRASMESLLALATPLVLGVLGHQAHARDLDAAGVAGLLGAQRASAMSMLPASVAAVLTGDRESARPAPLPWAPPPQTLQRRARLWPLLLLIPLAIVGSLFFRKHDAPRTRDWVPGARLGAGVSATSAPEPAVTAPPPAEPSAPAEEQKGALARLPGGTVGHEMAIFLGSSGGEPSQRFVFDHLNFEFATTNMTPDSLSTVDGVAEVLKAYPAARILIEGHTDATGVPEANERLARARAEAVKSALVARGVSADRITTAGMGQEHPLAANDTQEGRAKNRRTEIVVTRR